MIKINLNKSRDTQTNTNLDGEQVEVFQQPSSSSGAFQAIVKLIVMSAFIGGLIFYENQMLTVYQNDLAQLTTKLGELQTELEGKKTQTAGMTEVEKDAVALEHKLTIMKTLSRVRMQQVKALDYIQSVIPDKAWFSNVNFEAGKIVLNGYAISDEDLNELTRALENSALFSNVIVVQSKDEKQDKKTYKQFEIRCNTEVEI